VSARLAALGDQAVRPAGDRPACLLVGADHHEYEHTMLGEPLQQSPIHPKSDDGHIDSRLETRLDMAAADERHQQVDRHRALRGGVTHLADRRAQVGRREQPERAKAPRSSDGSGQLRARQATTHSGLGDRNLKAEPIQQVHQRTLRAPPVGLPVQLGENLAGLVVLHHWRRLYLDELLPFGDQGEDTLGVGGLDDRAALAVHAEPATELRHPVGRFPSGLQEAFRCSPSRFWR
jgi:hypothetical protein